MARRIVVEPVARIEGHARVTLRVDAAGRAVDARVDVLELRGFEAICIGRPIREMPALTARICGICPVAHALAAAQAGDEILGADPPPAARALRRLLSLASIVQSHATSFFFLAAPDLALDAAAPAEARNPFALAGAAPELVRDGILLRRFGGGAIEQLAGRRVHPAYAVPGGVTRPLAPATRRALAAALPEALAAAERTISWWVRRGAPCAAARRARAWLAHAGPAGELDLAGGTLRIAYADGRAEDGIAAADALARIVERPVGWSYANLCAWRDPSGGLHSYEVGPVARLAVSSRCRTRHADRAIEAVSPGTRAGIDPHAARLVEIVAALEEIGALLDDPLIESREVLAPAGRLAREGTGACEAPRGTLFHGYEVDGHGLVAAARIVAPTTQNARAMNAAVHDVARRVGCGDGLCAQLRDGIQRALRAFDPCLSCATHTAEGAVAQLRLVGPGGEVLDEWPRA
jgi:NAD-reducing hydrogenase large subunit